MSLSSQGRDQGPARRAGRVILGAQAHGLGEMSVADLQGEGRQGWTDKDGEEYRRRVRERAEAAARDIIAAAVADARALREQAVAEGLAEGRRQARAEAEAAASAQAEALARTLAAAQGASRDLWAGYRQDVLELLHMALRRLVRAEMDQRRAEILGSLLDQALDAIDSQRALTVRVHPQDQALARELLEGAKARHPGLERWAVRPDPALDGGGVILESDRGMVDNSLASRMALVEPILDQLASGAVGPEVDEAARRAGEAPGAPPAPAPGGGDPA
jgi:flagellar assembly protein FliH